MSQQAIDVIIQRVKKLFALSEGTTFDGECAAALKQAQALMAKYNLEMEQVLISEDEDEKKSASEKFYEEIVQEDAYNVSQDLQMWERWLGQACSDVAGVKYFINTVSKGYTPAGYTRYRQHVVFYGNKRDVAVARELLKQLLTITRRRARELFGSEWRIQHTSYAKGMACGLCNRAAKNKAADPVEVGAIVLAKAKIIEEWASEHLPGMEQMKTRKTDIDSRSFALGREHSKGVSLATNSLKNSKGE